MYRNIEKIIAAPLVNMGPVRLRQPIPIAGMEQISPFILLHHFDINMEPGHNKRTSCKPWPFCNEYAN